MDIDRRLLRPCGALAVLTALPILEAASMAARAFYVEWDPVRFVLGVVAVSGGALLLMEGMMLVARRPSGRLIASIGAIASMAAHLLGAVIGLVGGHGLLYGAAFPAVLIALLRVSPHVRTP